MEKPDKSQKKQDIPQEEARKCIKSFLQANGITHQELAEKTGYSLNYVNSFLTNINLTEKVLKRISTALDYPYSLLAKGEKYYGPSAYERLEERVNNLETLVLKLIAEKK